RPDRSPIGFNCFHKYGRRWVPILLSLRRRVTGKRTQLAVAVLARVGQHLVGNLNSELHVLRNLPIRPSIRRDMFVDAVVLMFASHLAPWQDPLPYRAYCAANALVKDFGFRKYVNSGF